MPKPKPNPNPNPFGQLNASCVLSMFVCESEERAGKEVAHHRRPRIKFFAPDLPFDFRNKCRRRERESERK